MKSRLLNIAISILPFILTACAAIPPKVIVGPDGTQHQLISCNYIEYCYEKATEVCGGKYQIVNTSNHVSGDDHNTSSTTNLLIKCKN